MTPEIKNQLSTLFSSTMPVFVTVETTGVSSTDVPSLFNFLFLPEDLNPILVKIPKEKEETALQFLGLNPDQYGQIEKAEPTAVSAFVRQKIQSKNTNAVPIFVTYNTQFQSRFLKPVLEPLVTEGILPGVIFIDITRLAWCIENAPAFFPFLQKSPTLIELENTVQGITSTIRKGLSYKKILTDFGFNVDNMTAFFKPLFLRDLLYKLILPSTIQTLLINSGAGAINEAH